MRVVAGTFRGRALVVPPGRTTRPLTDRVKETLFNILGHRFASPGRLPGVAVLDVFCGSGSLGIEALSRGAACCTFVERHRPALRCLRQNLQQLDLTDVATILTDNAWTVRPPRAGAGCGLIFVDPPYREAEDPLRVADLLERLAPSLAADGVLVFRHERQSSPPRADELRSLRYVDERVIGRMRLLFLARREATLRPDGGVGDVAGGEQIEKEHGPQDVGHDADGQLGDGQNASDPVTDRQEPGTDQRGAQQQ